MVSSVLLLLALIALPNAAPPIPPAAPMQAAEEQDNGEGESPEPESAPGQIGDEEVVTRHELVIDGDTVAYTVRAGTLTLADEDGTEKAHVFYVAYLRDGVEDPASRPLMFSFNGGPGSSSVWLHMGIFGPRRVLMENEGFATAPPYRLVDNAYSILDDTDLVFIDPVTTGYSRAAKDQSDKQFHGVDEDIRSVGEFIRLFTTRAERWSSPKFLAGESYGTTRAAGLARHLQSRHGMELNGVLLVSPILMFQTALFDPGNDLPYVLCLPTYTATAFHHGRLDEDLSHDLEATLAQVEAFALGPYATALLQGSALPDERRREVAEQLARFTGLSVDYVLRSDLRVQAYRFRKELRRDEGLTVGRLDSRFTGRDRDGVGAGSDYDPSMVAIDGPYTATFNDYVRRELEWESDLPYEILTGRVHPWSYGSAQNRYINVAEDLRVAMTRNPHLRVHVASGTYDMATPYFAARWTMQHMALAPELEQNISMSDYPAGHMMYIQMDSLVALKGNIAAFLREAVEGQSR